VEGVAGGRGIPKRGRGLKPRPLPPLPALSREEFMLRARPLLINEAHLSPRVNKAEYGRRKSSTPEYDPEWLIVVKYSRMTPSMTQNVYDISQYDII